MNLMGKIFTFMIFLMSTIFLVVSFMVSASDREWKREAEAMKKRASTATNNIDLLKNETASLEKTLALAKVSRATQLADLQSKIKLAQETLAEKATQFNEEQKKAQSFARELMEANSRLNDRDNEIKEIKANNKKLIDDIAAQFAENRNIEKVLFEQTAKLEQLLRKEADLAAQLAKLQKVMRANDLDENALVAAIAPKIEAVVTAVGDNNTKFAVAIGSDDGLRKGHEMDIYRSNRHVGRGVVVLAENNRSVLSIVKGMMNDIVREGDNVTTKLF